MFPYFFQVHFFHLSFSSIPLCSVSRWYCLLICFSCSLWLLICTHILVILIPSTFFMYWKRKIYFFGFSFDVRRSLCIGRCIFWFFVGVIYLSYKSLTVGRCHWYSWYIFHNCFSRRSSYAIISSMNMAIIIIEIRYILLCSVQFSILS